jgi:NDP-sugar pyrophosphorylase family protein
MILAAGYGTRLHPLTLRTPKPLFRIKNHYLIDYSLALLKRAGITEVIINTHYLAEQVREALGDGQKYGMSIFYSHEETLLGTGGGIKAAEWFLNSDPFVVVNSDVICDVELLDVIADHQAHGAHATMVVRKESDLPNHNEIMMNLENIILSVNHMPPLNSQLNSKGRLFTGIHIFSPSVFSYLTLKFSSIITEFYQRAIFDKLTLFGYEHSGFWMDLGTMKSLETAQNCQLPDIRP